jgi:hypothetical protein
MTMQDKKLLVHGDRGGLGKSRTITALAEFLAARNGVSATPKPVKTKTTRGQHHG